MRRVPSIIPALVLALLVAVAAWVSLGGERGASRGEHSSTPRTSERESLDDTQETEESTGSPRGESPASAQPDPEGLRGIVIDTAGRPLPGVRVELHREAALLAPRSVLRLAPGSLGYSQSGIPPQFAPLLSVESASDGRFELDREVVASLAAPSEEVRLCAAADGYRLDWQSGWSEVIDLSREDSSEITITLEASWTVTGTLVDLGGAPVADHVVVLTVYRDDDGDRDPIEVEGALDLLSPTAAARTSADGRFELRGLPAGHLRISSAEPSWLLSPEVPRWFLDPALAPTSWDGGTVVAVPPLRVSLRAIDAVTGAVLPDATARVVLARPQGFGFLVDDSNHAPPLPDADGWIALPPIRPYLYSVDLSAPGYFPKTEPLDFDPGTEAALEVELVPGARLTGQSVDRSGAPVVGAEVRLGRVGGPVTERLVVAITEEDGSFFVDRHRAGTFDLSIDARTVLSVERPAITLVAGQTLDLGTIRHPSGARISGRIAFANGAAPPWAYVRLLGKTAQGNSFQRRAPYDAGRFTFDGLPPGTFRLSIGYPDRDNRSGRHETEEVTITGEETRTLDVTLPDR